MKEKTCRKCRYFENASGVHGICSRYPPIMIPNDTEVRGQYFSIGYPEVSTHGNCGEFKKLNWSK